MDRLKIASGLSDIEVEQSRTAHGSNTLTPPQRDSIWKIFLNNFNDPIIRILVLAIVLSAGVGTILYLTEGILEIAETIGIAIAVLLAAGVSTWFVYDANKKFDILNQINDDTPVRIIRNGHITQIPKKEIVVGDIVLLEQGEEVPADGELLESTSLQINESTLTGEPVVDKWSERESSDPEATYPSFLVLRGTTVTDGHGIMEVTRVGDNTEFGKVAQRSTAVNPEKTPLNKQLDLLAKWIGIVGFSVAVLTFIVLFVKSVFFQPPVPTGKQLFLTGAVIVSLVIMSANVWLSIAGNVYEVRKKRVPAFIAHRHQHHWVLYGLIVLGLLFGIGALCGIPFWESESWISLVTGKRVLNAFMAAVTLIVVVIPEGLPMSVTLSLAMSMKKMLKANNLVRKMHACETMGAVTVICTDKTGTLTQNRMTVRRTDFYALSESQQVRPDDPVGRSIAEGIAVNSTAHLESSANGQVETIGNPTESALLLWLRDQGYDYRLLREQTKIDEQLTFSTERKYMATLVRSASTGNRTLYVKGAPEIVLSLCDTVLTREGEIPVENIRPEIERQLAVYQNQAMRTLGLAYQPAEANTRYIENGRLVRPQLIFLGIVALSDPIRQEVPAAIARCNQAGIQVKIVTGDTPNTAREIGRQIGLWKPTDSDRQHITGSAFAALSDEEALNRVQTLKIMSRARPTDKQRLVQLLQKRGEVVAVTGDGTNDAPALNFAHVGLSMGSGTSVAKEASDITLLDDSFNSIASAVMWGRSVYQNIQRFILFQLTINVTALIVLLTGSFLGTESPVTVTQMLWINLIMDTFAATALASLPPDEKVMERKPRKPTAFIIQPDMKRKILGTGILFAVILTGLLFYLKQSAGGIESHTSTGIRHLTQFFTVFVLLQFWNMFNAKTLGTSDSAFKGLAESKGFLWVGGCILIGQFSVVTWGGSVFRTVPLSGQEWLWIIGSTSFVLWSGELYRWIKRIRRKNRRTALGLRPVIQPYKFRKT